jgi:hypothetical protein
VWWDDLVPESDARINVDTVGVVLVVTGDCLTDSR